MLKIILSPAKKMIVDCDSLECTGMPPFLDKTEIIKNELQSKNYAELKKLWACNDSIATQNVQRLENMNLQRNITPAILAYDGIAFKYMAPAVFDVKQFEYIQNHLFILSGFYGVVRPFDGVVPYRLEMQAKLKIDVYKNLYEFWGDKMYNFITHNENGKKQAFFENAKLLADLFGIVPLMYGSLGLEYLTGEKLNADDIDILIPATFTTDRWNEFKTALENNGYTLTDPAEHTFAKDGIEYSYGQLEELSDFTGIPSDEIVQYVRNGVAYKLLSLDQYLTVYRQSSKDGYRVNVRAKKDNEKIEFIEKMMRTEQKADKTVTIINLASEEYSKTISKYVDSSVKFITITFADLINDKLVEKGTKCKMARGEMVRFMAENNIENPEEIKKFNRLNYVFSPEHTTENNIVFIQK